MFVAVICGLILFLLLRLFFYEDDTLVDLASSHSSALFTVAKRFQSPLSFFLNVKLRIFLVRILILGFASCEFCNCDTGWKSFIMEAKPTSGYRFLTLIPLLARILILFSSLISTTFFSPYPVNVHLYLVPCLLIGDSIAYLRFMSLLRYSRVHLYLLE